MNLNTLTPEILRVRGRHDPCIVPRAVPCIEAAAAIAVYDALLGQSYKGGISMELSDYRARIDQIDRQPVSYTHLPYIEERARQEGILLDPVYTGKAWAKFLMLVKEGYFDGQEHIAFVHTGGAAALFAMELG